MIQDGIRLNYEARKIILCFLQSRICFELWRLQCNLSSAILLACSNPHHLLLICTSHLCLSQQGSSELLALCRGEEDDLLFS